MDSVPTGSQSRIIINNPYGFDPLNPEVRWVLQRNGRVEIVGQARNGYKNRAIAGANERGFRVVQEIHHPSNTFGFTDSSGNLLTGSFTQYILERVN